MSGKRTTLGDNSLRCLNCGEEYVYATPIGLSMLAVMARAWDKEHARCKPTPRGAARMEYTTLEQWRAGWDTGASSIAIYDFFKSGKPPRAHPYDPADFGRCYRLLKVAPTWRALLHEIGCAEPKWEKLCDRWGELEKLYEEELPSGRAPKLYAAMKECIG